MGRGGRVLGYADSRRVEINNFFSKLMRGEVRLCKLKTIFFLLCEAGWIGLLFYGFMRIYPAIAPLAPFAIPNG